MLTFYTAVISCIELVWDPHRQEAWITVVVSTLQSRLALVAVVAIPIVLRTGIVLSATVILAKAGCTTYSQTYNLLLTCLSVHTPKRTYQTLGMFHWQGVMQ